MRSMKPTEITLHPLDNVRLANLCGALDENIRQIETAFDVTIARRGEHFTLHGSVPQAQAAVRALRHFYECADVSLSVDDLQLGLIELSNLSQAVPLATVLAKSSGKRPKRVLVVSE